MMVYSGEVDVEAAALILMPLMDISIVLDVEDWAAASVKKKTARKPLMLDIMFVKMCDTESERGYGTSTVY